MVSLYRVIAILPFLSILSFQQPAQAQDSALSPATLGSLQHAADEGDRAGLIAAVAQAIAANPANAAAIVEAAVRLAPEYRDAIVAVASAQRPGYEEQVAAAADRASPVVEALAPLAETPPWSGEVSFGGSLITGNTEHSSISAGGSVRYLRGRWTHRAGLAYEFARDSEETSADRLALDLQSNYDLNDRTYLFGFLGYEDDRFSGFNYVATQSGGIGYRLIETESVTFSVEGGPGYRISERTDTGNIEDEVVFRGAADLLWALSDSAELTNGTAIVQGSERRTIENTIAITADLFGDFDGRLSFNVRHEGDPPPGTEATDTLTRAALVYDF